LHHDAKSRASMLVNVKRIDLDSLTEMKAIPSAGLITFIRWDDPDHDASLEICNVGVDDDNDDILAYATGTSLGMGKADEPCVECGD
jgi:hypothetical protein